MTNLNTMFFGTFFGAAYQTTPAEVPLLKGVIVLAYLLLKEDSAKDFGIGFMLGKWLMDIITALEIQQEVANALIPALLR